VDIGWQGGFDPPFDQGLAPPVFYYSLGSLRGMLGSFHG
jgi:hypothetical protein